MPAPIDLNFALRLSPPEVAAYLQRQGYELSFNWFDVWQEANARSFTVAKVASLDVLQAIHDVVKRIVTDGITERDFIRQLTPELQKLGWWGVQEVELDDGTTRKVQQGSPRRLRAIYETNLQTALSVGRYKQQITASRLRPFWQYQTLDDQRVRLTHAALHQRVFRADDPIWRTIYPPNGFGCRCSVRSLSLRRLEREGLVVESSEGKTRTVLREAGVDKVTGEVVMKPVTVVTLKDAFGNDVVFSNDPGWNYNPGEAWLFDEDAA